MFATKIFSSPDSAYGDHEKDANALLIDLEKGLRSPRLGDQSEAIVRFPRLFEKYPFPILINSAFLKLADLYRIGSNFLRQCILKVTKQSERHLDKILNTDEFLRRIFSVVHSNDPVARAITYRTLGEAARIIAERKNVHHSILTGLESRDSVEQKAAVYSAGCFAAHSRNFAAVVCAKLEVMIESLSTPTDIKLQLIPIFQHMHHEAKTTRKVLSLCRESLLQKYPSRSFTKVTLQTISQLTAKSLIDVQEQIDLLLEYVSNDCRVGVQTVALRGLLQLAHSSPHMWAPAHIQALCEVGLRTPSCHLRLGLLSVLVGLCSGVMVTQFSLESDGPVLEFCAECCYDQDLLLSCSGARFYQQLLKCCTSGAILVADVSSLVTDCATIIEMQLQFTADPASGNQDTHKMCVRNLVEVCVTRSELAGHFVDILLSEISTAGIQSLSALTLCHGLSALVSSHNIQNHQMPCIASEILHNLQACVPRQLTVRDEQVMVVLVTLLFQTSIEDGLSTEVNIIISKIVEKLDGWASYKIARQATRYGHHAVASKIFSSLAHQVSSEHNYFWLNALRECCQGENCLHGDLESAGVTEFGRRVSQAEIHYHKSVSALKAASTPSHPLEFQIAYLEHRAEMLQMFTQIVQICCSFQTSPPPAIATSLAMTTGRDFHRCRHVISQLRKCQSAASALSDAYNKLLESSFDADKHTLENLRVLQEMCQLLVHVLESVFVLSKRESASTSLEGLPVWKVTTTTTVLEAHVWHRVCEQVLTSLHQTVSSPCQATLTHHHINCIRNTTKLICSRSLCMPRYFYQRLQCTSIKLALSPQPRSTGEPISVHYDTSLSLKVEGVIEHGRRSQIHRAIKFVHIAVNTRLQTSASTTDPDNKSQHPTETQLSKITEPHNDYFSGTLLLAFPALGLHQVTLTTSVQDDSGTIWHMGSPVTLLVSSYDEAAQRQQQQQYAAQRQQQRAALVSS